MKKVVLTAEHEDLIRKMRADGKSPKEILEFFSKEKSMEIPYWKIGYICKKGKVKTPLKKTPNLTKILAQVGTEEVILAEILADILKVMGQNKRGYMTLILYIRGQLLKERGEIHKTLKKAKVPIPPEDELPPPLSEEEFNSLL